MWRITLFLLPVVVAFSEGAVPFEEPRGPLTLRQAIGAALANNPHLVPFTYDVRIGDARIVQARLRPNPELSLEIENIQLGDGAKRESVTRSLGVRPSFSLDKLGEAVDAGEPPLSAFSGEGLFAEIERETQSGAGPLGNIEMTLTLSLVIELGGKRAARIGAAERERAVMEWDFEVARFDVVGQVVTRFAQTLAAQERLREEQALVELAEKLSETVGRMVDAGNVSPLEARRAGAEAEHARIALRERERELEQARLRLAIAWGSTQPVFTEAVGDFTHISPLPTLEQILARREQHPMLKRWAAELARRGAVLSMERSKRVPDLTLGLGYRATAIDEGDARSRSLGTEGFTSTRTTSGGDEWEHSFVLEASLPLPLFDRNQGAILEAELNEEKLGAERRAWDASLMAELTELYAEAQASAERTESLASRVLPELETTYALTQEGYQRGKFDFLAVLDAQRAVVGARLEILDARIVYQLAIANMERLVGAGIVPNSDSQGKESAHE